MSRKKARDNAFKCVYELEFGMNENLEKILENWKFYLENCLNLYINGCIFALEMTWHRKIGNPFNNYTLWNALFWLLSLLFLYL